MDYYSTIEKNQIMPFAATGMDLEIVILSEVSQTEKEKYSMLSLTCGIQKELIQMNLPNRKRRTELENELMVAWRKDEGRDS